MSIASGTVLRVVASLLFPDNVIAQNVFNLVVTDLVTSDDEEDVVLDCVDYIEALYTAIRTVMFNGLESSDVKVYEFDPLDNDWDEVGTGANTITYTGAAEMVSHGVAAVVHMRTIDPDTQGTKYLGGFVESSYNASNIGAPTLTALAAFLVTWYTPFSGAATGGDFSPVVWSPTGTVARLARESGYVNGQVGYQRRRKPGVGS